MNRDKMLSKVLPWTLNSEAKNSWPKLHNYINVKGELKTKEYLELLFCVGNVYFPDAF